MNSLLLSRFTQVILAGALRSGMDRKRLQSTLDVTPGRLARLLEGSAKLNADQGRMLEAETEQSLGQLALVGIEQMSSPQVRAKNKELLRGTKELMRSFAQLEPPVTSRRKTEKYVRDPAA
jgi:hypothetical protein